MAELSIEPRTDGELEILVEDVNGGVSGATVAADVYRPDGTQAASAEALSDSGGGTYILAVDAAWSEVDSQAVEGEFLAIISADDGSYQATTRVRWVVQFTDDT